MNSPLLEQSLKTLAAIIVYSIILYTSITAITYRSSHVPDTLLGLSNASAHKAPGMNDLQVITYRGLPRSLCTGPTPHKAPMKRKPLGENGKFSPSSDLGTYKMQGKVFRRPD